MSDNPYLLKPKALNLLGLVKSPFRLAGTVVLVLAPLTLLVLATIDFIQDYLYSLAHKGKPENREVVFFLDCLTQTGLCSPDQKRRFWPLAGFEFGPLQLDLSKPDPIWLIVMLATAFISFAALTSPVLDKSSVKNLPVPPLDPDPAKTWLLGGLIRREWQADPGVFITHWRKPVRPYFLTLDMLAANLLVVATPGSGKTSSVIRPFIRFARRAGCCILAFDAKGNDLDPTEFDLNFDITDFEHSFKLNLFSAATPAQAGEQLGEALIPNLNEEKAYFSDVAKSSMAALVEAHFAVYRGYPELLRLLVYLKNPDQLNKLIEMVKLKVTDRDEVERLCSNVQSVIDLGEMKGDLLGNLRLALQPLTNPEIARFLVSVPDANTYSVWELVNRPGLVRLGLPVAEWPKVAPVIGRLFLTQFNYAVLAKQVNTEIFKAAVVDEAANFISTSIGKGMSQARSNRAGFILAFQSLAQIPEKGLLDTVFAASGTKIVMGGVGDEDAEKFSRVFGELEFPYVTRSKNISYGSSSNTGSSGSNWGGQGGGSNSGTSSSTGSNRARNISTGTITRLRRKFLPSEIRGLAQYHAIIEASNDRGQRWQAQIIDLEIYRVGKLSQNYFRKQKSSNREEE